MKLAKLMLAMIGGAALTFVAVGLTFAAPAASHGASNYAALDRIITPTVTITHTQPVASVIALYFKVPYAQVLALHDSGLGYGEIARVFMTVRALSGRLTLEGVLARRESGLGWGEIAKQYGVRPGGNGLGTVKSGRVEPAPSSSDGAPNCPGNSCNAPGKNKPGKNPKQ
jgi:hypothetical protein